MALFFLLSSASLASLHFAFIFSFLLPESVCLPIPLGYKCQTDTFSVCPGTSPAPVGIIKLTKQFIKPWGWAFRIHLPTHDNSDPIWKVWTVLKHKEQERMKYVESSEHYESDALERRRGPYLLASTVTRHCEQARSPVTVSPSACIRDHREGLYSEKISFETTSNVISCLTLKIIDRAVTVWYLLQ